jgi:hypothetical protein
MSLSLRFSSSSGLRSASTAKNLKTDLGAAGDNATNDAQKFLDFQTYAAPIVTQTMLYAPAGTYLLSSNIAQFWAVGCRLMRLAGAGLSQTTIKKGGSASDFHLGGKGQFNDNTHSARCATVLAGATSVTLTTPAQASRFTVGGWAMMAGFDLQGLWHSDFGFPTNSHYFDHVKVLSADTNTGVVTFDRPLTHNYKSTWPVYHSGSGFGADQGGAATLYALNSAFETETEIRDLTIDSDSITYLQGKNGTFRNVAATGAYGVIPSENVLWQAIDYSAPSATMEADKFIKEFLLQRCTLNNVWVQSSSVDLARYVDCTLAQIAGTPKAAIIQGGTCTLFQPGATSYGRSDSVTIGPSSVGNPVISAISSGAFVDDGAGHTGFSVEYTMSGGVITCPNTSGAQRWAVPGTNLFWKGTDGYEGLFRVIDVTQDATNTYIQTNLAGGFPTSAGTLNVSPHPCPVWNCLSATGCDEIVDLSQSGAQNRPLYEYSKRTYAGVVTAGARLLTNAALANSLFPTHIGTITSIKINVVTPYTFGASALSFKWSQFDNNKYRKTDGTIISNLGITINARIAGERTISPSGNLNAQSLDVLPTLPAGAWLLGKGTSSVVLSADVSANGAGPVITVEVITDQGVVLP